MSIESASQLWMIMKLKIPVKLLRQLTRGDDYNLNIEDARDTITVNDNDEDAEPIDRNQPRISVADVAVNTILESTT